MHWQISDSSINSARALSVQASLVIGWLTDYEYGDAVYCLCHVQTLLLAELLLVLGHAGLSPRARVAVQHPLAHRLVYRLRGGRGVVQGFRFRV